MNNNKIKKYNKPKIEGLWQVLEIINNNSNKIKTSQIYKTGTYSYSTFNRILKYMLEKNLIQRMPLNKRSFQYQLTDKGLKIFNAYKTIVEEIK